MYSTFPVIHYMPVSANTHTQILAYNPKTMHGGKPDVYSLSIVHNCITNSARTVHDTPGIMCYIVNIETVNIKLTLYVYTKNFYTTEVNDVRRPAMCDCVFCYVVVMLRTCFRKGINTTRGVHTYSTVYCVILLLYSWDGL